MNWRISRLGLILCLAAILIICQGCGQGTSPTEEGTTSPDSGEETTPDDEQGESDETGEDDHPVSAGREAMVFVVDPDYNPIFNAVIGTSGKSTDMSGVFYGEVKANDSGWVPVHAPGYVTNYAKPSPYSGEYDLYFVTLAPVNAAYYYQGSSGSHLLVGDPEEPQLEVDLEPGALNEADGFLELTQIDPREISMDDAWAELDKPYGAILSFDISAWNLDGEALNLAENKTAMVLIPDDEHDVNDLVLHSFDPESGS